MSDSSHYQVVGEVIKLIHGELPAVRWTCGRCGEDSCTIFYEPETVEKPVDCESCGSTNLVHKLTGG
jgi:ribosomal protein S27E